MRNDADFFLNLMIAIAIGVMYNSGFHATAIGWMTFAILQEVDARSPIKNG